MTNTMQSEVERNKQLIEPGNVLYYTDQSNCQRWVVIEVIKDNLGINESFWAQDEANYKYLFDFNELQLGWSISEITKKSNQNLIGYSYK